MTDAPSHRHFAMVPPRPPSPGSGARPTASDGADGAERPPAASPDPRPLGGYTVLLATYGSLAGAGALLLRRRRDRIRPVGPMEMLTLTLATSHLSRLIAKDSVTATVRRPFTRFQAPAGEGEVNEEVIGSGVRHAVGELVTCPFCLAQWVATGLLIGTVVAPALTTTVASISAVARLSDFAQLLYDRAKPPS